VRVERPHALGQDQAIRKIDSFLDELLARPLPSGIQVEDARKTWTGNRMEFSFRAKKGFFGTDIRGTMDVTDAGVVLDAELPALVASFVGEERVRDLIARQLDALLARA
jgi:hypothetical protein